MDNVPAHPGSSSGPRPPRSRREPAQAARSSAGRGRSRRRKGRPLPRGGKEKEGYGNAVGSSIRLLSGASRRPCFRCPFVEKYSIVFEQPGQGGERSGEGADGPGAGCDGGPGRHHELLLFLLRRVAEPAEQGGRLAHLPFPAPPNGPPPARG